MGETVKVAKRAKLWNRGANDYRHVVMGQEVFIPKDGFIECSRSEAMKIRGHCTGLNDPVHLDIELLDASDDERVRWIDHRTGQEFPTRDALLKHLGVDPAEAEAARNGVVYPCPMCNRKFTDAEKAREHMRQCLGGTASSAPAPATKRKG
jgi:hypothetical protein